MSWMRSAPRISLDALLGLLLPLLCLATAQAGLSASPAASDPTVLLILGAAGEVEYGSNFVRQAQSWEKACRQGGARLIRIGLEPNTPKEPLEQLRQNLAAESLDGPGPLWLVLVGHGTFDGKDARFNLEGPDLAASDLADWLMPFRRTTVIINTASASAPFLAKLSRTNRIVITATRSGFEQNYARFGQYLAEAIASSLSDLDRDGQTSLLEAFLAAARQVSEFYRTEGRLATEHALIDDNGDTLGTPADWFRGVRAVKKPQPGAAPDGVRAHQMHLVLSATEQTLPALLGARRDVLEQSLALLRETKTQRPEAEYYRELEDLLLELARLYETPPAPRSSGEKN